MFFFLFVSALFLLAFVFLDMSHEVLKKQIRRISAKKVDDPRPLELDYPFFRLGPPGSGRAPWQRYGRRETQVADRDDFIRRIAPEHLDKFILQERMLIAFRTALDVTVAPERASIPSSPKVKGPLLPMN